MGAHVVVVDDSGFTMIPTVRRTWVLVGQTPGIHYYRRDRVSSIGVFSISPNRRRLSLYFRLHPKQISQDEVYDFLWYLLRHLRGHVVVAWDEAAIHDPRSLRDFCRQCPRLRLKRFPAYTPQLNPIETAWHAAKLPLANSRPDDILSRQVLARFAVHTGIDAPTFTRRRLSSFICCSSSTTASHLNMQAGWTANSEQCVTHLVNSQ
jgi:transposase